MDERIKKCLPTIILIVILVVFAILLIINETNLFHNERNYTFKEAVNKQVGNGALNTKATSNGFENASKTDVSKAMKVDDKNDNINHMQITEKVALSKKEVNHMLRDKGVFKNKGQAFLDAQDKYDVNVIYLISHALVETGNGKSELAQGLKDDGKRYYNFFGIGAFDENALHHGSSYAKKEKWDSPDKAIMGGAKFVRENYFDNNQLSLYQMRWHPEDPGKHQYASDINWDDNIAQVMKHYYEQLGIKKDHINKHHYL